MLTNINTNTTHQSSILDRVQKILRKTTDSGCSESEAQTAIALASKILLDNNLTFDDVDTNREDGENDSGPGSHQPHDPWQDYCVGEVSTWDVQQDFGSSILRDFFFVQTLRHVIVHDNGKTDCYKLHIFGKSSNVVVARFVFSSLMRITHQLWIDRRVSQGCPVSDRRMYLAGVFAGFRSKLIQERRVDERSYDQAGNRKSGSTALAVIDINRETQKKFLEHNKDIFMKKTGDLKVTGDPSVYSDGWKNGREININQAIEEK